MKYYLLLLGLILSFQIALTSGVRQNKNLRLPMDSSEAAILIGDLVSFLDQKEGKNSNNTRVNPDGLLYTSILLDELKGIDKSANEIGKTIPYLNSIVRMSEGKYLLQLSYIATDNDKILTKLQFRLIADKKNNLFFFSSLLGHNTRHFDKYQVGQVTIMHFGEVPDSNIIREYEHYTSTYDSIIGAGRMPSIYYVFDNAPELLSAIGIDYSNKFNGYSQLSMMSLEANQYCKLLGYKGMTYFDKYDPHDLWHERLKIYIDRNLIYKPVDEGCAFLFGGSWGYNWQDIVDIFEEKYPKNSSFDWLDLFDNPTDFGIEKSKPLKFDYFINALIVKQIMEKQNFDSVKELITIGKDEPDTDKYFEVLDELLGINRENFNSRINLLMNDYVYDK